MAVMQSVPISCVCEVASPEYLADFAYMMEATAGWGRGV